MLAQSRTENRERSRLFHFNMDRPWYVVHTESSRESRAVDGLRKQKFVACYPQELRSKKKNAFIRRWELYPLMPGYVFVSFNVEDDFWKKIFHIEGVRRVLSDGERPIPVPKETMVHIRDKEAELCNVKARRKKSIQFCKGSRVKIVKDPSFSGLEGQVVDTSPKLQIVIVEIDLFGRLTPVMMPVDKVRLV